LKKPSRCLRFQISDVMPFHSGSEPGVKMKEGNEGRKKKEREGKGRKRKGRKEEESGKHRFEKWKYGTNLDQ